MRVLSLRKQTKLASHLLFCGVFQWNFLKYFVNLWETEYYLK
jgi:hypothetical protein